MDIADVEIYHKIEPLHFEDNVFMGFFYKGHIEEEQWERVAREYLRHEYEIEPSKYTSFKKGWYKVLPNRIMMLFNKQVKGSFAVMECLHD